MKSSNTLLLLALTSLTAVGCSSASHHRAEVQDDSADRVTVGVVQKEIYVGMSGGEVLATIGSPNIVSTDADRNEVWVYDKVATDVAFSDSEGGVLGLIFGPHYTTVFFHDFLDYGQAESAALRLGRDVRVENVVRHVLR